MGLLLGETPWKCLWRDANPFRNFLCIHIGTGRNIHNSVGDTGAEQHRLHVECGTPLDSGKMIRYVANGFNHRG